MGGATTLDRIFTQVDRMPHQRVVSTHSRIDQGVEEIIKENARDRIQSTLPLGFLRDTSSVFTGIYLKEVGHARLMHEPARTIHIEKRMIKHVENMNLDLRRPNKQSPVVDKLDGLRRTRAKEREVMRRLKQSQSARERRTEKKAGRRGRASAAARDQIQLTKLRRERTIIETAVRKVAEADPLHYVVKAYDEADRAITKTLRTLRLAREQPALDLAAQFDVEQQTASLDACKVLRNTEAARLVTITGDSDDPALYTGAERGWCLWPFAKRRLPTYVRSDPTAPAGVAAPAPAPAPAVPPNPALPRRGRRDPTSPALFVLKGVALDQLSGFGDDHERRGKIELSEGQDYVGAGLPGVGLKAIQAGVLKEWLTTRWHKDTLDQMRRALEADMAVLWKNDASTRARRKVLGLKRIKRFDTSDAFLLRFVDGLEALLGDVVKTFALSDLPEPTRLPDKLQFKHAPRPKKERIRAREHPLVPVQNYAHELKRPERPHHRRRPRFRNRRENPRPDTPPPSEERPDPPPRHPHGRRHYDPITRPPTKIRIHPLQPSSLGSDLARPHYEPALEPTDEQDDIYEVEEEDKPTGRGEAGAADQDEDDGGDDDDAEDYKRTQHKEGDNLRAYYSYCSTHRIIGRQAERCLAPELIDPPSTHSKRHHTRLRPLWALATLARSAVQGSLPFVMRLFLCYLQRRLASPDGIARVGAAATGRHEVARILARLAEIASPEFSGKRLEPSPDDEDIVADTQRAFPHLSLPVSLGVEAWSHTLAKLHTNFWFRTLERFEPTLREIGLFVGRDMFRNVALVTSASLADTSTAPAWQSQGQVAGLDVADGDRLRSAVSAFLADQLVDAPFLLARADNVAPSTEVRKRASDVRRSARTTGQSRTASERVGDDEGDGRSPKRRRAGNEGDDEREEADKEDDDEGGDEGYEPTTEEAPAPAQAETSMASSELGKALAEIIDAFAIPDADKKAIKTDIILAVDALLAVRDHTISLATTSLEVRKGLDGKRPPTLVKNKRSSKYLVGAVLKLREMVRLPLVPNYRPDYVDINAEELIRLAENKNSSTSQAEEGNRDRLIKGAERICNDTLSRIVPHLDPALTDGRGRVTILEGVFDSFQYSPTVPIGHGKSPVKAFLRDWHDAARRGAPPPRLTAKTVFGRPLDAAYQALKAAFNVDRSKSLSNWLQKERATAELMSTAWDRTLWPTDFVATGPMAVSATHIVFGGVRVDRVRQWRTTFDFFGGGPAIRSQGDLAPLNTGEHFALVSRQVWSVFDPEHTERADNVEEYFFDSGQVKSRVVQPLVPKVGKNVYMAEVLRRLVASRPPLPSGLVDRNEWLERVRREPLVYSRSPVRLVGGSTRTRQGLPVSWPRLSTSEGQDEVRSLIKRTEPTKLHQAGVALGGNAIAGGLVVVPAPPDYPQPFAEAVFKYHWRRTLQLQRQSNRAMSEIDDRFADELASSNPAGPAPGAAAGFYPLQHEGTVAALTHLTSSSAIVSMQRTESKIGKTAEMASAAAQFVSLLLGKPAPSTPSAGDGDDRAAIVYVDDAPGKHGFVRGPKSQAPFMRAADVELARRRVEHLMPVVPSKYTGERCSNPNCVNNGLRSAISPPTYNDGTRETRLGECEVCGLIAGREAVVGANLLVVGRSQAALGVAPWRTNGDGQ